MEIASNSRLSARAKEDFKTVQMAIGGDEAAYSQLLERYKPSIYHTMYKMVNNKDDAEDLTLEAFGKAFNKLQSYAPSYAFSTWLFKIAINNGIDYLRKKRIKTLSIDETIKHDTNQDFAGSLKAGSPTPEEHIIKNQRGMALRYAVSQLNEKYRVMIELRYFNEFSYEEIANELQIPLGTVKAQLFRAKELLYDILKKPGASAYLETTVRRKKTIKRKSVK